MKEPGIKPYLRMVLNILSIYIFGSMQAKEHLPKSLKHFGYEQKKDEPKIQGIQNNVEKDIAGYHNYSICRSLFVRKRIYSSISRRILEILSRIISSFKR